MICPYLSGIDLEGHLVKVDCLRHDCAKYVQVQGQSPQSGELISDWRCSDAWIPLLLIENAQKSRETGAAVESFRNEVVRGAGQIAHAIVNREEKTWLESK